MRKLHCTYLLFFLLFSFTNSFAKDYLSITNAPAPENFITVWDMSKPHGSLGSFNALRFGITTLPNTPVSYSWTASGGNSGSGTIPANSTQVTITGLPGNQMVTLSIEPNFIAFSQVEPKRLMNVTQWGSTAWSTMENAFLACTYLRINATDIPNLTAVSSMKGMFYGCAELQTIPNIESWNTENITDMSVLFKQAFAFNGNISSWNTENVTNMEGLFYEAKAFNQNIGNWNTGRVANMRAMFYQTETFNQDISRWNTISVKNMDFMFGYTYAFNQNINSWNTANVTNMGYMFQNAKVFNQNISNWNTASVTDMREMFYRARMFNQNIGNWQLNAAVNMGNMLDESGLNCANYSRILKGWANNPNTPSGRRLGAWGMQYGTNAEMARNFLTNTKGWTIIGGSPTEQSCGEPFVTVWDMRIFTEGGAPNSLRFGITTPPNEPVSYTWTASGGSSGSGSLTTGSQVEITGLPAGEIITLSIASEIKAINITANNDKRRLLNVAQWGDAIWSTMENAFSDCVNLNVTATDVPNLSAVTSMRNMFYNCQSLTGPANINSWNTTRVNDMRGLFQVALAFNQDISSWNTTNVTNMSGMFSAAKAFNQNINRWDTSNVTDMSYMFTTAEAFNQPIGRWNTRNVTNMAAMFGSALVFNKDISNWNTSKVTNMSNMFGGAKAFNQNISTWNTVAVTDMSGMFANAEAFDQPIGNWNTSAVTNMYIMFAGAKNFNQDIGNWNTAAVTNMNGMFDSTTAFNKPIGNWNITAVTNMHGMFNHARSFNQDISRWNVSSVTRIGYMFVEAIAFNQNIGNWQLNPNADMTSMLDFSGMDCQNYSLTLNGWADNPNTPSGRNLGAKGRQYGTNAEAARNFLINTKGWTITDDSPSDAICGKPFVTVWDMRIFTEGGTPNSLRFGITTPPNEPVSYTWTASGGSSGSGSLTTGNQVQVTGLPAGEIITLSIASGIKAFTNNDKRRLINVAQWGDAIWSTMENAFSDCVNLNVTATDIPNLSAVNSMRKMFNNCQSMTGPTNIGSWNTTTVNNMEGLFGANLVFDQDISSWNTANVTNMGYLFSGARAFNQDLSNWNTANVTNMGGMFQGTTASNLNISNWNTQNVKNMQGMFAYSSVFNEDISSWNTSNVTNMSNMFGGAKVFNQNISTWNTAAVTDMSGMFANAEAFDQPIGNWNTSAVTNMYVMFASAKNFNQDIGNWNTAAVTNMSGMFDSTNAFNKPIGNWNITAVTDMHGMFNRARSFNQDISRWNISSVTRIGYMFVEAIAFNQNIGNWQLNPNADMSHMLDLSGMDCQNYSLTLQGWANNPAIPSGRNFGASYKQYGTNAEAARNFLINTKGWTITGDSPSGQSCGLPQTITATDMVKTYGDAPFVPTATASSGLEVSYLSADNSIAEAFQDNADGNKWKLKIHKAGQVNITAQQAGNETYNLAADVIFTLTINKASLSITADTQSKEYGTADPVLTYTASGLVNGDTEAILRGSLSRTSGEAVGIYVIGQGTLDAENYDITFTGADFTITERLIVDTSTQTNVTCNGGYDGSAKVNITGGTAPYTYSWSPNGGIAATATELAAGDYTVTITDANGSTITKNFNITQPQAVEPPTAESAQEFCRAVNPTISDLETEGIQVKWYASANATQELSGNTLLANGTTYYVSQTINGCESPEKTSVIITLNDQLPTPEGGSVQDFEEGAIIADLVVIPVNSIWYASYDDAMNNINPLSPTAELEDRITYYAIAMADGQCSSLPFAVTVNVTLGLENSQKITFKYYPNPVKDYLNIRSSETIDTIEVYSLLGQLVKKQNFHSGEVRLFLGDLSNGTYAVSIQSKGKKSTIKMVKK